ncbi:MAG: immune inhibitor A [Chloroflexi bacterium]|nr:immune inhibitor A [Chloroflexota bacterium]
MPTSPPLRPIPRSPTSTSATSTSRPTPAPDRRGSRFFYHRPGAVGAVLVCLALALLAACSSGGSEPDPTATSPPAPTPTATPFQPTTGTDAPPDRDLLDLARRFGAGGDLPRTVELPPPQLGDTEEFELILITGDPLLPPRLRTASATLRSISEHAYLFVERAAGVGDADVQAAARSFEQTVWPQVTEAFGLPAIPGVDGDPRIVILIANLPAWLGGYVTDTDSYTKAVAPRSNQREIIYLNARLRPFGSPNFTAVLAHEFQHLVHGRGDPGEESWVNEGLSELAAVLVVGGGSYGGFLARPDTQLNTWAEGPEAGIHYDASGLFFAYLFEQSAGGVRDLVAEPGDGIDGLEAFLRDGGRDFAQLFADWAVANFLDQPGGPFGYDLRDVSAPASERVRGAGEAEAEVRQFAADYLELRAQDFSAPPEFAFEGFADVPVLDPGADGAFWWANRGDTIDATLTRELDLTAVRTATLTFRTWFDIERWFDFAHVTVSRDGGRSWAVLTGRHTTTDDPMQVLYGPSYYGVSGGGEEPRWIEEEMDLTRFAGSRILIRFEYVTDESLSKRGWAIDDIAVPEIGFLDDAEADVGDWRREGFLRVTGPLPQRFELRLITFGSPPAVQVIPLDGENKGTVRLAGLGSEYQRAVIVVMGTTEGTTEAARYRYEITTGGTP